MDAKTPSESEALALAGLAAANAPWLAGRLRRLGEMSGLSLPAPVVDSAVGQCSLVLRRILNSEGRPAFAAQMDSDPATELGREQALVHMQAGLDLPGSLRVLRLMRRAFDDLIRESWIDDKLSRARAHEDVERFFDRTLLGLYVAWADRPCAAPAPDGPAPDVPAPTTAESEEALRERGRLAGLLAQREAELRRTLDAAHKATALLRQERQRAQALEAELSAARAKGQEAGQEADQNARRAVELEAELARQREALALARDEAQGAIAQARTSAQHVQSQAQAQAQEQLDQLQERLRQLGEDKARLSAQVRALREEQAGGQAGEKPAEAARLAEELAEYRTLGQLKDERLAGLGRELEQTREAAAGLQAGLSAAGARIQALRDEAQALRAERDVLLPFQAQAAALAAERDALAARQAELASQLERAEVQVRILSAERGALAGERDRLRDELDGAQERQARAERGRDEAEKRAAQLTRRQEESAQAAETGLAAHMATLRAEAARVREDGPLLLASYLSLAEEAVAAVDGAGRFEAWNPRFPALFGLSEADLARGLDAALPHMAAALREPEAFLARLRRLIAHPAEDEPGFPLATIDGQALVLRSLSVRDAQGRGRGRLLALGDMSLRRDMEGLLDELGGLARQEPEGGLTDFLRLPQELLADPILAPALAEALTPAQASDVSARLAQIRDSGQRLVSELGLAVDVFRMEHGLYRPAPVQSVDLAQVARRALREAAPLAERRQASLRLTLEHPGLPPGSPLPPDVALPAPVDPALAHALAVHLLRDALLAAPRQSEVDVSLAEDDLDQCLRLAVTRPGDLTKKARAGYFAKPGAGGESLAADDASGVQRVRYAAGLMARALGGSLSLSGGPGEGTTVTLRLPRP